MNANRCSSTAMCHCLLRSLSPNWFLPFFINNCAPLHQEAARDREGEHLILRCSIMYHQQWRKEAWRQSLADSALNRQAAGSRSSTKIMQRRSIHSIQKHWRERERTGDCSCFPSSSDVSQKHWRNCARKVSVGSHAKQYELVALRTRAIFSTLLTTS
jgi:hypothetical protein